MNCTICDKPLAGETALPCHPECIPPFTPIPGQNMSEYDLGVKDELIQVVRWAQEHSRRSLQVQLGCSEVGHECDRRLAYKIAGVEPTGFSNDPWPAVVGTSIHAWMENAVNDFQHVHGISRWVTEMEVLPSPLVKGHTDLYDSSRALVLDWKFPGTENMRKMRQDGPPYQYQVQVMLYGLGHANAGRQVDRVGIVALGRQGWLKDMYVWTTEFDQTVADAALARIYSIGRKLIDLNILDNPASWGLIESTPSRLCTWCPWFRREHPTIDVKGCPGK